MKNIFKLGLTIAIGIFGFFVGVAIPAFTGYTDKVIVMSFGFIFAICFSLIAITLSNLVTKLIESQYLPLLTLFGIFLGIGGIYVLIKMVAL